VIDPRTTSPLDMEMIVESVEQTGRLLVVDEANPLCGTASEVIGSVAIEALGALKCPPRKLTAPHTPVPAAMNLEELYIPSRQRIETAIRELMAS